MLAVHTKMSNMEKERLYQLRILLLEYMLDNSSKHEPNDQLTHALVTVLYNIDKEFFPNLSEEEIKKYVP